MKRAVSVTPMIVSLLYALLPICSVISTIYGYDFTLYSYTTAIIALTVISLAMPILLTILDVSLSKTQAVFSALLLPLSVLNGMHLIVNSEWEATFFFVLICCGCSIFMLYRFVSHLVLKILSGILSVVLIPFLLFAVFMHYILEGLSSDSVVKSLASPQNTYTAEIIDNIYISLNLLSRQPVCTQGSGENLKV